MVPAGSGRIPRVPPYSGTPLSTARLPLRGCHPLRPAFPDRSGSLAVNLRGALLPPACLDTPGLGSVLFARHYSGHRYFFLFLRVLRCFSSPRSPRLKPVSGRLPDGLPHSEIPGSKLVAVPRGFSQLSTSFFASGSLGIPPAPYARVHAGIPRMPILLFRLPRYLFPVLSMNSRA